MKIEERDEAIRFFETMLKLESNIKGAHFEYSKLALEALKQEPCDDAVDRQVALDAMYELCDTGETLNENPWRDNPHIDAITDAINDLPSVTPQPKTGRLILLDECSNSGYYCSECQKKVVKEGWSNTVKKIKYCPNCGAKMSEIPTGAEGSEKND